MPVFQFIVRRSRAAELSKTIIDTLLQIIHARRLENRPSKVHNGHTTLPKYNVCYTLTSVILYTAYRKLFINSQFHLFTSDYL